MSTSNGNSKQAIGFLTVVEQPQFGLFGGYLLLNAAGRPLEFHCTAPIKPNRAQEILYGPTLEAFLYGEQIGQTLINQAKTPPILICTDREPALAAREHVATPMVLVLASQSDPGVDEDAARAPTSDSTRVRRFDTAHSGRPRLATFRLGQNHLALPERAEDDRRMITEQLGHWAESLDLAEPFQRIREAIDEAQQCAR
jgi:hypothetical protein